VWGAGPVIKASRQVHLEGSLEMGDNFEHSWVARRWIGRYIVEESDLETWGPREVLSRTTMNGASQSLGLISGKATIWEIFFHAWAKYSGYLKWLLAL
jgi:hypothetical protein